MTLKDQLRERAEYARTEGMAKVDYVCENRVLSKTGTHPVLVMVRGPVNCLEGLTLWQPQVEIAVPGRVHLTWEDIDELVKIRNWHGPINHEAKGEG